MLQFWVASSVLCWSIAFASVLAKTESPAAVTASPAVEEANFFGVTRNSPQSPAPAPAAQGAQAATFIGDAKCIDCHDQTIKGTLHGRSADPRTPAAKQGCESCHGPGSKHAEDPTTVQVKNFKTLPAREVNATCTTCHNRGEHALWDGSQHEARNLSCVTCHSVHSPKSESGQLKTKTQPELCQTCHRDKVAKLDRSGHMPVREGKMQCSTCHNTHGSTNTRLLRKGDSPTELCTSCHADKRGPFLWEHAPSRDGCVTCHDPHGSSNERMLVAKPPILCQRCHVSTRHPSVIYDQALVGAGSAPSARVMGRSCVTCHSAIHGSNHPSGQRFIR
ncbi:MAG TPA: DmsE family decaheme c-type cytochrome [Vicinamibacterales bacterium]|nr:DmsE family decaheme c-type cytochrome [Vicinamibacterales bacterium]